METRKFLLKLKELKILNKRWWKGGYWRINFPYSHYLRV